MSPTERPDHETARDTARPAAFWLRCWPGLALLGGYALVAAVVSPVYEVPQNDEWAYYLVLETWFDTGELSYLGWNDPTLLSQVFWGGAFAQVFGLSYTTLRCSTLALSFLGVLSLYGILRRLGSSREVSLFGAALLLFNPLYLILSYSFNTDVPYLGLATAATWVFLVALERRHVGLLLAGGLLAALATGVRQPGVLVPGLISAYVVWTWPGAGRRIAAVTAALLPSLLTLWLYGVWLRGQTQGSWLDTVSNLHVFFREPTLSHLGLLAAQTGLSIAATLMSLGLLLVPLCVALLPKRYEVWKSRPHLVAFGSGVAILAVGAWLLAAEQSEAMRGWPYQLNCLTRLGCLPQFPADPLGPSWAWTLLTVVTPALGAWLAVITLSVVTLPTGSVRRELPRLAPTLVFVASVAQFLPSFVQIQFYDRYLIVALPGVIALALAGARPSGRTWMAATLALALSAAVSVEYMRAYVDRAGAAWKLAEELVAQEVEPEEIRVGFEWEGAHLYREALELHGPERRFDFQKEWPWQSLLRHGYFVREFDEQPPEPFTEYRGFFGTDSRFVGVVAQEKTRRRRR